MLDPVAAHAGYPRRATRSRISYDRFHPRTTVRKRRLCILTSLNARGDRVLRVLRTTATTRNVSSLSLCLSLSLSPSLSDDRTRRRGYGRSGKRVLRQQISREENLRHGILSLDRGIVRSEDSSNFLPVSRTALCPRGCLTLLNERCYVGAV